MKEQHGPGYCSRRHGRKRGFFGLFVIVLGVWWLLRRIDPAGVPDWALTWPVLLIAFGVLHLFGHGLRGFGGVVMILTGGLFLLYEEADLPEEITPYIWPVVVIIIGVLLLLKPRRKRHSHWKGNHWKGIEDADWTDHTTMVDSSNKLDTLVVFSGIEKDIISKQFCGGEITVVMGGVELNFSKADMEQTAEIDLTVVMGGAKLIVPRNWEVRINTTNIAGGVEDKRSSELPSGTESKTLVLNGVIALGGVEISSN